VFTSVGRTPDAKRVRERTGRFFGADARTGRMADHADDPRESEGRVTSPMEEFTTAAVGRGLAVLVVGLLLTFGIALALA
jgi:hypothetical protein